MQSGETACEERKGIPGMKKLVCLVLVLLCFVAVAAAESVPSKSTADMVVVTEITTVDGTVVPGLVVAPVTDPAVNEKAVEACSKEIEKLVASASVVEYFGEVRDTEGNTVSLTEVLGTENVTVNEFVPVVVANYNAELGDVNVSFKFSTPYEAGKKVVVLVGIVDPLTGEVEWVALEGEGTGVDGAIAVEFTPEVLEAIQNGTAMMAVVSE